MAKILSACLLVVAATLSAGCAYVSEAPADQSTQAKSATPIEGKGTVYAYRPGRAIGAANQLSLKVNGKDAGGTGPGTFFKWDLSPGVYTFLSSTTESSATIQLDVKPGQVYYIRQDARIGLDSGRVTMKQVDANQGRSEIQSCRMLVSAYIPE